MDSARSSERYRQDAVAVTQLRIDTDGTNAVCAATLARIEHEYPEELSDLIKFANIVFPPDQRDERQRFLDSKMTTYAVKYAARDLAMFAEELKIHKPLSQE